MTWGYEAPEHELNQGDLFEGVPFHLPVGTAEVPEFERMLGLITSHSCDCDRYERAVQKDADQDVLDRMPLLVAPVHGMEELEGRNPGLAGDIRATRVPRYFHLADDGHQPEQVADLWFEQPVSAVQLLQLDRRATLTEECRLSLLVQIWRLRSHLKEQDVFKETWADEA